MEDQDVIEEAYIFGQGEQSDQIHSTKYCRAVSNIRPRAEILSVQLLSRIFNGYRRHEEIGLHLPGELGTL